MKNIFLVFTLSLISMATNKSNAQPVTNNTSIQNTTPSGLNSSGGINENSGVSLSINARAFKNFHKTFYDIKDETWYNAANGGYISRFTSDSVTTVAAYSKRGVWQYTLRYFNEKKLPHNIRSLVKSAYYDYDILGATEVLYEDQNIYQVYVQDEDNIKTIAASDDDIIEIKSFKRQ